MYEPILQEDFAVLNASELCKILGDYNRMRLLLLLSDAQERTISEIAVKLQSSPIFSITSFTSGTLAERSTYFNYEKIRKICILQNCRPFYFSYFTIIAALHTKTLLQMLKAIPQKHYAFGVFLSLNYYAVISRCNHQSMLISSYCGLPIFSSRMATS